MITLNDAKRVIAAAEKKATELGQPMNVAVGLRYPVASMPSSTVTPDYS